MKKLTIIALMVVLGLGLTGCHHNHHGKSRGGHSQSR
jgi:hypothetical protein